MLLLHQGILIFLVVVIVSTSLDQNGYFARAARIRATNIVCITYDKTALTFRYCHLKMVKRGIAAVFVYVENHTREIRNLTYNVAFMKKLNGYRPFMYNISGDVCKLVHNVKYNPIIKLIYEAAQLNSSLIHECPYNHDTVLHNFLVKENFLDILPVPSGEYAIVLKLAHYNIWKVKVTAYASVNNTIKGLID